MDKLPKFVAASFVLLAFVVAASQAAQDRPRSEGNKRIGFELVPHAEHVELKQDRRTLFIRRSAINAIAFYPEGDLVIPDPFANVVIGGHTYRLDVDDPTQIEQLAAEVFKSNPKTP